MAKGLCIRQDGAVLVEYGPRKIAIPEAQYRANGYRPLLEKLPRELTPGRDNESVCKGSKAAIAAEAPMGTNRLI